MRHDAASIEALNHELPPPLRLAIAYAPAAARPAWTALLGLDRRLERAALAPREPLVAQIRLAWWRERFAESAASWPLGEPLLATLQPWEGERAALAGLVDGWEGLVGGEPSPAEVAQLAAARGGAMAALARVLAVAEFAGAADELGVAWATDDLAARLSLGTICAEPAALPRLPRELRPLPILATVARRDSHGLGMLARIVRLGLLGR